MSAQSTKSAWTEVRVLVPQGWQELVAEALALGPCTSVAFGRSSLASEPVAEGFELVRTFVADWQDTPALRAEIRAALAGIARRSEVRELEGLAPEFRALPPEDYANSWKKSWKPFRVGRIAVLSPWQPSRTRASDVGMELEPGGAFGSGRHATTRMCLRTLQARLVAGSRVLDAGSGSGILSVAAALLGAEEALGFDIDPNARPWAERLARANGVEARTRFLTAGFECLDTLRAPYDGLLANIYSDIVSEQAAALARVLRRGGWFAFSGCPAPDAAATRAAVAAAGLAIEQELVRGRWHTFVGTR